MLAMRVVFLPRLRGTKP
jgi:hypothetical protein